MAHKREKKQNTPKKGDKPVEERIVPLKASIQAGTLLGMKQKSSGPLFTEPIKLVQVLAEYVEAFHAQGRKVEAIFVSTPLFRMLATYGTAAGMDPSKVERITLTFMAGKVPVIQIPDEPRREIIVWKGRDPLNPEGPLVSMKKFYGGIHGESGTGADRPPEIKKNPPAGLGTELPEK